MISYSEGGVSGLESRRRKLASELDTWKQRALTIGLPALGICLLFLLTDQGIDPTYAAFGLAAVILTGLGVLIGLGIRVSKFKGRVQDVVLPLVVARTWPEADFSADQHLDASAFIEAEIADGEPDQITGSNLLAGDWAGVPVRMSTIQAIERRTRMRDGKLEAYNHTLFTGLLLVAELGGYLRTARIRRRYQGPEIKIPVWMGGQDPSPAIATERSRPDRLESHYTPVPSGSELDTHLFDGELEGALVKLTKHFSGGIHYQLNPRRLLLAVSGDAIQIEINLKKPLHQQPSVEKERDQLLALLGVVEATREVLHD
ncbi:MAG: hypothetical protein AAGF87_18845 [Bacteroidota bacterium]